MKRLIPLLVLAASVALAEDEKVAYYKAIAQQNALIAQWESSLTDQQKALRQKLQQGAKQTDDARAKLAATCGKDHALNEDGDCVDAPKTK